MLACKIRDIKSFTGKLLIKDDFDSFAISEAVIMTYNSFIVDGHLRKEHFTDEEWEALGGERFSKWETIKPFCFQAIKGKKTPESFKMVLLLSESEKAAFFEKMEEKLPNIAPSNVNGMFLNIKYENSELNITCGTSLNIFTIDKTLDNAWAAYVKKFLDEHEIDFEVMI